MESTTRIGWTVTCLSLAAVAYGAGKADLLSPARPAPPALGPAPKDVPIRYKEYVEKKPARKGMTMDELRKAYPDHTTPDSLNYSADKVEYLDKVEASLGALANQDISSFRKKILNQGVAVFTERYFTNHASAIDFIHTQDLPLIITSDAILHTVYRSYDNMLMKLETDYLKPELDEVLNAAIRYVDSVYIREDYGNALHDYLMQAHNLLIGRVTEGALGGPHPFGRAVDVDWTQLKPRGHYTKSPELSAYFRAMMWLSRSDLSLQIGGNPDDTPPEKITLMKKASLALWDAVAHSGSFARWQDIDDVITFMVGRSDGASLDGLGALAKDLGITSVPRFLAKFPEKKFDKAVAAGGYGLQTILSESMDDDREIVRIAGFLPQRFVPDSYAFSEIVNAKERTFAPLMPNALDAAFLFGDNSALTGRIDAAVGILDGQRELFDALSPEAWHESLYGCWMDFIRKLNGAEDNNNVSPVFRTSAWRKKMRNTQLASWAELRHNTILYAKQSYTSGFMCSFPLAYVEPYPEFFHALRTYAERGNAFLWSRDSRIGAYFARLGEIAGKLEDVARLTAAGDDPTADQTKWLRQCITTKETVEHGGCTSTTRKIYDGWFFDLIFDPKEERPFTVLNGHEPSYVCIADVHSKPADDRDPQSKVWHAASGNVNLMAVVVETKKCKAVFLGPTSTYYDVVTAGENFQRLTDEDWKDMLLMKDPRAKVPEWAGEFRD